MALKGKGVLAVWTDIEPGLEEDFDHWYVKEHVPERAYNPGFLSGRRYELVSGRQKAFAFYETESVEALASEAYIEILKNPTEWSARLQPRFRNTTRMVGRIARSEGAGAGGAVATLQFTPAAGREGELESWVGETAFPALLQDPGVVGAHLFQADLETTRTTSRELGFPEPDPEQPPLWAVVVDGTDTRVVTHAVRRDLGPDQLIARGAADAPVFSVYRLLYALER